MEQDKIDAARERLKSAIPHLRIAIQMAKISVPDGTVRLGIIATGPSGAGQLTAQFDSEDFFDDLSVILGIDPGPSGMSELLDLTDTEKE